MTPDLEQAYAHCEKIARAHYENFSIGSHLLPRAERRHLAALYAYCRGADDIADEPDFAGDRLAALDAWEVCLDEALNGQATDPVFVATAHTLATRGLAAEPLRALLRAFRSDVDFEPFTDFTALRAYCANSADPVGRLVLGLFDVRDDRLLTLSDDVCTGLQLANFWQDLSVDLEQGRCYLPADEIAAHPGAGSAIEARKSNPGFKALLQAQIDRTRRLLSSGEALARQIPWRAALEVRFFAHGGLRILERTESLAERILVERPKLGRGDFAVVFARALRATVMGPGIRARRPHASKERKEFA